MEGLSLKRFMSNQGNKVRTGVLNRINNYLHGRPANNSKATTGHPFTEKPTVKCG